MFISANESIPSMNLLHNNNDVDFAFRTMEEIHEKMGHIVDVPHRHNYFTILWANNACGEHNIDYKKYTIRPNLVFFVSPGQVHQVTTYSKPEGVIIMFTREFLHKNLISESFITDLGLFFEAAATPPLDLSGKSSDKLWEISQEIKNIFYSDSQFKVDELGAYLKLFLIECNKLLPKKVQLDNPQKYQSGTTLLRDFKSLIESNYKDWHKVSDYATELNVTADYLNSVIRTTLGKTAKSFIQERIILEAKRLGVHTQLSNKEIAYQIGFNDPGHFSKFFKKIESESFSNFRANILESVS